MRISGKKSKLSVLNSKRFIALPGQDNNMTRVQEQDKQQPLDTCPLY